MNGNEAAAYIAYAFSEASIIYPITPSSEMASIVEKWGNIGKKNIFNQVTYVETMQSEKGVGGMLHGLLRSGTLSSTFTSSQGLLLMLPSLYKIVGELLPGVIHVAARSVSTNALSIYGDHSDVMAVRQSGVIMIASSNVQQVALISACAHLLSVQCELPVLHFFDGFDTSHEVRDIQVPSYKKLKQILPKEAYIKFKGKALRNDQPKVYGTAQQSDTFFQQQEIINSYYKNVSEQLTTILSKCNSLFGTKTNLIDYYGDPNAETVIVSMGSVSQVIQQVIAEDNRKIGFLDVHLFRPFPEKNFLDILPKTTKNIVVLDRTKETGATAEPLLSDVRNCVFNQGIKVIGGRYGLGSKNTTPADIRAALYEVKKSNSKNRFTLGIKDDLTFSSLLPVGSADLTSSETLLIKTWGRGSDGSVSCNRQTAEIIGEKTDYHVQCKFWFDPRKSNNLTTSELQISKDPILTNYRLKNVKVVNCYHESYLKKYELIDELQTNGLLLVNTNRDLESLSLILSEYQKKRLAEKKIRVFTIHANGLARKYELGPYINTIMQASLFYLINIVQRQQVLTNMQEKIQQDYTSRDINLGTANLAALAEVEEQLKEVIIPSQWKKIAIRREESLAHDSLAIEKVEKQQLSIQQLKDKQMEDGGSQLGMTQFEKRGLTNCVPDWNSETCIQCNLCATICPHAAIRPFVLDDTTELDAISSKEFSGENYRIQVSPLDCTGCHACIDICPQKSLQMKDFETQKQEIVNWEKLDKKALFTNPALANKNRTLQYRQPLLEFSGACAGCGETAYVKMLTQLFGSNLVIANATGCSSIWGGTFPHIPYTTDKLNRGPAWATSLLENNAEYGAGITAGLTLNREEIKEKLTKVLEVPQHSQSLKKIIAQWLALPTETNHSQLLVAIANEREISEELQAVFDRKHYLNEKVTWIVGGDGWAYDIDSDGIDYLINQDKNINILILDNGSYANTGGQYTSSTPKGAKVKFRSNGNQRKRKNLTYLTIQGENTYVAQICIGANPEQALQVFKEAVDYDGPSIVFAYSPCLMQGIRLNSSLLEQQLAVSSGFWPLIRYNPKNKKSPLRLESSAPDEEKLKRFFEGERRFSNSYFEEEQQAVLEDIKETYKKYQFLKEYSTTEKRQNLFK